MKEDMKPGENQIHKAEKKVGSLKVIFNQEDYSEEKSKKLNMLDSLFGIFVVVVSLVLLVFYVIFSEDVIEDSFFCYYLIFEIIFVGFAFFLYFHSFRKRMCKGKEEIYDVLDFMNRMEDFSIYFEPNEENLSFRADFKGNSVQYFGQYYMTKDIFCVKNKEDAIWIVNFEGIIHKNNILEVDLTQYPKTRFEIKQENI